RSVLLLQFHEVGKLALAGSAPVGPDIDDHDLALEAADHVAELGVLDGLQRDLSSRRLARTSRDQQDQQSDNGACAVHGMSPRKESALNAAFIVIEQCRRRKAERRAGGSAAALFDLEPVEDLFFDPGQVFVDLIDVELAVLAFAVEDVEAGRAEDLQLLLPDFFLFVEDHVGEGGPLLLQVREHCLLGLAVGGIVQRNGDDGHPLRGMLFMHLDQMRKFLFAAQSVVGPEIDDDDLALELANDAAKTGGAAGLEASLQVLRLTGSAKAAGGQSYHAEPKRSQVQASTNRALHSFMPPWDELSKPLSSHSCVGDA